MNIYIYIYIYAYTCIYIYVCIYTYIYMHLTTDEINALKSVQVCFKKKKVGGGIAGRAEEGQ